MNARGFSLVEALVSVLILSIGLLGIAALHTKSLSGSHTAATRTQSVLLATDIAERMRANRIAVDTSAASNYDTIAAADNSCRAVHFGHSHAAVACTPAQLAADDLFDWQAQVAALLPAGVGRVCLDSTPDDGTSASAACDGVGTTYAVKIWWTEKARQNVAAEEKRFATLVQP